MKTDRRKFLTMMAAGPIASSLAGWAGTHGKKSKQPDKPQSFYVWVHGIFGITYVPPKKQGDQGNIVLVSPGLTHPRNNHVYKFGRQTDYPDNTFKGLKDMSPQNYYFEIKNYIPPPDPPSPDPLETMLMTGALLDYDTDLFYFSLPYPAEIIPLRFMNTQVMSTLTGNTADPVSGKAPLAHVLRYPGVGPSDVRVLWDDHGQTNVLWGPGTYNHLHFFAEEDPDCNSPHRHDARGALGALLDCYTTQADFALVPKEKTASLDIIFDISDDLKEQFFLSEWRGSDCYGKYRPGYGGTIAGHQCPHLLVATEELQQKWKAARLEKKASE